MDDESEFGRKTVIGPATAAVLFAALLAVAALTLKGSALALAVIIVGGLATKGFLSYWREKKNW